MRGLLLYLQLLLDCSRKSSQRQLDSSDMSSSMDSNIQPSLQQANGHWFNRSIQPLLQEVKGHLFDHDSTEAFWRKVAMRVYAIFLSCYDLEKHAPRPFPPSSGRG